MKKVILIASLPFIAACNSGGGNTNVTPAKAYYVVPNWQNDTLIGMYSNLKKDTMFSLMDNGKSCIKYRGVEYEIKAYMLNNAAFTQNAQQYFVDIFTMSGTQVNSVNTQDASAEPSKYFDNAYSTWKTQHQGIMINHPPFTDSVVGGLWSTVYK
ncbi:hypothetical protein [Taibaiella soli]|uniref:Lipoprotein n=1 Tax=Taibaiella soli TaxID=1649169 RepID=A0A2W2BSS3_9BACT|nr:hypothetical protein [Taibaiella soli]PZF70783.1 hypothetical protein DN068_21720 [Taibaiella soli]